MSNVYNEETIKSKSKISTATIALMTVGVILTIISLIMMIDCCVSNK